MRRRAGGKKKESLIFTAEIKDTERQGVAVGVGVEEKDGDGRRGEKKCL